MSRSPLVLDQMTGADSAISDLLGLRSRPDVRFENIFDASDLETLFPQPVECIQLSQGDFQGNVTSVRIGALTLFRHATNRGIHLRTTLEAATLLIGFQLTARDVLERGRRWGAGEALVIPGDQLDVSALRQLDVAWLQIRLDAVSPAMRESLSRAVGRAGHLAYGQSLAFRHLRAHVTDLLRLSRTSPGIFATIWQSIQGDLLAEVDSALTPGSSGTNDGKLQRRGQTLVHRVERFMWENVEEPLTLERICASMDCGMRSLIYAFKDSFGLGPMAYLKIRRLNAARRKLKAAHGRTRIFDIAADYGFWHMGHFGADYKRMFGMTASETIASSGNKDG